MKLAIRLAYKNLIRAGLKTWLNALALSFAFVLILFYNGMIDGWNDEARRDAIEWEYGNGHLRHTGYDPADPFSIQNGHGKITSVDTTDLTPVLLWQGSIYTQGRAINVVLRGIKTDQNTVKIPAKSFQNTNDKFVAVIGSRMAESAKLKKGDKILLRWRDKNGTFDAKEFTIIDIFVTNVPFVDVGQIWLPLETLQEMTGLKDEATFFIASQNFKPKSSYQGWTFVSQEELLKPITNLINSKKYGAAIIYLLLLLIGLLVIFDTLALSIFRRQKEIGTLISLGLTNKQTMNLFIVEGIMYSILGIILGAIYGTPIFIYLAKKGISFPVSGESLGIVLAPTIYSVYSPQLIISTILLLVISSALVSWLAAKKITKMNPVEALKGKAL